MRKPIKWILTGITLLAGIVCLVITAYSVYRIASTWLPQQDTPAALGSTQGFQLLALIFAPAAFLLPAIAFRKLPLWASALSAFVLGTVPSFFIFGFVAVDGVPISDSSVLALAIPVVGFSCGLTLSLIQWYEHGVQSDKIKVVA